MLVNFYIDPDAVDNDTNRSHINALRNRWQQFGVLAHPSKHDGGFTNIRHRFPGLNQSIQRIWARAWREIENDPIRFLKCGDSFQVALISQARARDERIPDGDSRYFRGVEAVRLTQINDSREFTHAEDLGRQRIAIGERISDLWQERFQQLARHTREVAIVDEWAVRDNTFEGLVRFLNLLDGDSNGCAVTIYSSPETELQEQVTTIIDNLSDCAAELDGYGISSIEVRLRPEDDFRLYAHERHFRFDNRVIDIGRGARIFQFDSVREATRTSFRILSSRETDDTEYDLDNRAHIIADHTIPIGPATP